MANHRPLPQTIHEYLADRLLKAVVDLWQATSLTIYLAPDTKMLVSRC